MTEQKYLQSQYNLAYSVYSELAKQVETAQIQVKEDTPILTVIEPVRIPLEKSKPNRMMILTTRKLIGGVVATGITVKKEIFYVLAIRWKKN